MLGTTDHKSIGVSLASNNSSLVNSTSSHGITSNWIPKLSANSIAYLRSSAFSVVKNLMFLGSLRSLLYLISNAVITELSNHHETNTQILSSSIVNNLSRIDSSRYNGNINSWCDLPNFSLILVRFS